MREADVLRGQEVERWGDWSLWGALIYIFLVWFNQTSAQTTSTVAVSRVSQVSMWNSTGLCFWAKWGERSHRKCTLRLRGSWEAYCGSPGCVGLGPAIQKRLGLGLPLLVGCSAVSWAQGLDLLLLWARSEAVLGQSGLIAGFG
jgi:hypothetical protein